MVLPTNIVDDQAGHAAIHNATNTAVNTNTTDIADLTDEVADLTAVVVSIGASYTTVGRPSAVTEGAGAYIYDTTLTVPLWSNGVVWCDATGTPA